MLKKLLPMIVALTALPVGATTVYSSYSAMADANSGLTFTPVDFNPLVDLDPSPSYTLDGVNFQASSGTLTDGPNMTGWGTGILLRASDGDSTITITLPTGALAFGGHFGAPSGTPTITLVANGDAPFTTEFSTTSTTPQYWGFVSTTPFTSITITTNLSKVPALNQFVFGMPASSGGGGEPVGSEAPEPSAMALMGGALIAIPLLARWRRQK